MVSPQPLVDWLRLPDLQKTLPLGDWLFLVNDHSQELAYHLENKISTPVAQVQKAIETITSSHPRMIWGIVPDKTCLQFDYLRRFITAERLYRPHVTALLTLPFVVDGLEQTQAWVKEYHCLASQPADTHPTMVCHYAVYSQVLKKLGITVPEPKFENILVKTGDLLAPINKGSIVLPTLTPVVVPYLAALAIPNTFTDLQLRPWSGPINHFVHRHDYLHIYMPLVAKSSAKVLVFHDSNVGLYEPSFPVKTLYAQHFRQTVFYWGTYSAEIVKLIRPDIILVIMMERFLNTFRG